MPFFIYTKLMWLILALIGHSAKALGFLGDKLFVEKLLPNPKVLAFLSGIGGVFFLLFVPWFLKPASSLVIFVSLVSGSLNIFALIYFYRAVDRDEISRVVPTIGSITPIAAFVFSYLILGERLYAQTFYAFVLLVLGGILIAFHSFKSRLQFKNYSLLFLEIWVGLLFALSAVLLKFAFQGTDDISAFLWSRIGSFGFAALLLLDPRVRSQVSFSGGKKSGTRNKVFYVLSRIFAGLAPLVIVAAISLGSVTLVNALQGIQYPLLFILAIIFSRRWPRIFQEEISRETIVQKSLATLCILLGLALLI